MPITSFGDNRNVEPQSESREPQLTLLRLSFSPVDLQPDSIAIWEQLNAEYVQLGNITVPSVTRSIPQSRRLHLGLLWVRKRCYCELRGSWECASKPRLSCSRCRQVSVTHSEGVPTADLMHQARTDVSRVSLCSYPRWWGTARTLVEEWIS